MKSTERMAIESAMALPCCVPRYVWREVNYCMFLYDRLEDIYLPEQAYQDILSGRV